MGLPGKALVSLTAGEIKAMQKPPHGHFFGGMLVGAVAMLVLTSNGEEVPQKPQHSVVTPTPTQEAR